MSRPTTFGERLFERRIRFGMTQRELGAAVGRTQTCVSYWEADRREPSLADLAGLAKTLEISTDWLVLGARTGILGTTESAPAPVDAGRGRGTEGDASMQGQRYTRAAGAAR